MPIFLFFAKSTTEPTFVIHVRNGVTEWVPVTRGASLKDLVEVYAPLQQGDLVIRRGTDELREGTRVKVNAPAAKPTA